MFRRALVLAAILACAIVGKSSADDYRWMFSDMRPGTYGLWYKAGTEDPCSLPDSVLVSVSTVEDERWVPDESHPNGGSWVPTAGVLTFQSFEYPGRGCYVVAPYALESEDVVTFAIPPALGDIAVVLTAYEKRGDEWRLGYSLVSIILATDDPPTMPIFAGTWKYLARFLWAPYGESTQEIVFTR